MGDNDDFVTADECRTSVSDLRCIGSKVQFHASPGATHSFDVERSRPAFAATTMACKRCKPLCMNVDTQTYSITGQRVTAKDYGTYTRQCTTRGIHLQCDPKAKEQARALGTDFLRKNFGMEWLVVACRKIEGTSLLHLNRDCQGNNAGLYSHGVP